MLHRFLILLAALWAVSAGAARAEPWKGQHVELELVSGAAEVAPGSTFHVALRVKLDRGWHTYWKNAGDAGLPAEFAWTLPDGWRAGEVAWPRPHLMPEGPLMTYGWEDAVLLPVPVTAPASAAQGSTVDLSAQVTVLVCDEICIPESTRLSVPVRVGAATTPAGRAGAEIARAVASAPKPAGIRAAAVLDGQTLRIAAVDGPLPGADLDGAYFFAETPGVVKHAAAQRIEKGPRGLTFTLEAGKDIAGGLKGPVTGLLVADAGAWLISAEPGALPDGASGGGAVQALTVAQGGVASAGEGAAPAPRALGLPLAVLLALLGGLILNLMPCVFPVLAMKAAALAGHAHAPAEARRDGLAFTAGVLTTFVALALVLLAAKAAGQAAGWGFQLQSPWTTGTLALVMLAVGLNLSGVFHVGLSLQGAGGLNRWSGLAGSFLTGALAVVVAAPCFAPFMTEAVTYGLTHSALEAVVVFLVLGLGFALPYLALSLSPALARRLPKPGAWMNTLKSLLAFPMYGAAAWLVWVFAQQTASGALGLMLAAAVTLALAFFLVGRAQEAQAMGRRALVTLGAAGLSMMATVLLAATAAGSEPPGAERTVDAPGELTAEPWSAERVAALQAEGRPVFVNFTAAWCVTCKVNERGALGGRRTAEALERTNAAYLVADWTRRDETIARELARHGRSGVPLYLVYRPGDAEPQVLPQLLTEGAVVRALEGR